MSIRISGRILPSGSVSLKIPLTVAEPGQVEYTTVGTFTFTVPENVTSISAVAVGGGGNGTKQGSNNHGGGGGGGAAGPGSFNYPRLGGRGAVRIIWGGGRSYPSNARNI